MIKYVSPLLLLLCLACGQHEPPPRFSTVETQLIYRDSVEIRALLPVNDSTVWFAGNHGKIGLIKGDTPMLANIQYAEKRLAFRAMAQTSEAVFVLSIDNPAVLYKIGFDGEKATYIDDVYLEEGEGVFYNSLRFWNDREGIAMGDPVDGCLSILITRDGGNHWKKLSCDQLPPTVAGEAAFAASNSNIAHYKNHVWIATGGARARIFHSADKGKNWEVFDTPILSGEAMTGIYAIDFYDTQIGVAVGGDHNHKSRNTGNKAVTTNGGKTWKLVADGRNPGYRSSVRFVPGSQGREWVAVGDSGIAYSPDFGKSWHELSKEGFYALEFVNDTVAFASGRDKVVRLLFKE